MSSSPTTPAQMLTAGKVGVCPLGSGSHQSWSVTPVPPSSPQCSWPVCVMGLPQPGTLIVQKGSYGDKAT